MAKTKYPVLEEAEPDPQPVVPLDPVVADASVPLDEGLASAETRIVAPTVPFPKTWWVQPGKILAGPYPGDEQPSMMDERLGGLLDAGIRSIICLQEEDELNHGNRPFPIYRRRFMQLAAQRGIEVACLRFAIKDMDIPTRPLMELILDALDGSLNRRMPVYVHCWAGHGRTATVIGCWLVRHGIGGEQSLAQIARLREFDPFLQARSSPQTEAQRAMIRTWLHGPEARSLEEIRALAAESPVEMTGTHEAINYILRKGYTPTTRSGSSDFVFKLGECRARRDGMVNPKAGDYRTIVGYAFDARGVARYIVRINSNSFSDKEASQANQQYGPVSSVDEKVVASLSLLLAAAPKKPSK